MPDKMLDKKKCGAVIYCRLACEDDALMQAQLQTMRDFAKAQGFTGWTEYVDNGFSGLSPDRPGLAKLGEDIRAGRVQTVFVRDISRLYRDVGLCRAWFDEMRPLGVKVLGPSWRIQDVLRQQRQICAPTQTSKAISHSR